MCLLCIEVAKERMTLKEARRALSEMVSTASDPDAKKHYEELQDASDTQLIEAASDFAKNALNTPRR